MKPRQQQPSSLESKQSLSPTSKVTKNKECQFSIRSSVQTTNQTSTIKTAEASFLLLHASLVGITNF